MRTTFNNPKPLPPNPTCIYFYSFCFQSVYIYDRTFYMSRSNDNSRMLFSVFTVFPDGTVGRLAGDVLHIPWAQDLLLVSFCGCCEVQLLLFVSAVEQSASNMAWKLFAKLIQTVCEEEEESFLIVNLSVLCVIQYYCSVTTLPMSLLVISSSMVSNTAVFELVHEVAAARKGSSCFKSCMGHFLHPTPR